MNENLRRTGRTTRLLSRAMSAALTGQVVHVLTMTNAEAQRCAAAFDVAWRAHFGPRPHSVWFEIAPPDFDCQCMTVPGFAPNHLFLADHTVLEAEIERMHRKIDDLAAGIAKLYPLTV